MLCMSHDSRRPNSKRMHLKGAQDGQVVLRRLSLTEVEHVNLRDDDPAVATVTMY